MIKILLGFLLLAATHANVFKKGIFHVTKDIEIDDKVKVNGGWSVWSGYLVCSVTCGCGIKKRTRTCTNPAPSRGGNNCVGDFSEAAICNLLECPINGGWSHWGNYLACSTSCGCGIKIRTRNCTNPAPSRGGNSCAGDFSEAAICNLLECPTSTTTTSAPTTTKMVLSTTNAASKTITARTTTTPTTASTTTASAPTTTTKASSTTNATPTITTKTTTAAQTTTTPPTTSTLATASTTTTSAPTTTTKALSTTNAVSKSATTAQTTTTAPTTTTPTTVRTNICLDGWSEYAGNCYICEKDKKIYQDSLSSCKSYGGSLLSVENQAEYSFILKYMSQKNLQDLYFWIGFDDNKNKAQRKFEWTDGTPVTFTNWYVGEPNNINGIEHCTEWEGKGGFWNDVSCDHKLPYICKVKKGYNAGWANWNGWSSCGVSCGNGNMSRTRVCLGAVSSCVGKNIEIGSCYQNVACPVRTNICRDGWSENAGNCYICEKDQKTYQDSLSSCKSYGGSLLSVENQAEYSFILKYMSQKYRQVPYFWIGFDDNKNKAQKKFEWTDGTPVTYTNWNVGEPNNANGIEHCTGVEGMGGFWNDVSCDYKLPYICKVKKGTTITPTTLAKPNSLQGDSILPKSKRNLKLKYKKKQIHPGFHSDSASSLY